MTDLEKAARFPYLQRVAFGGKVTGRSFGVIYDGPARFNLTNLAQILEDIHERLTAVIIENLDWKAFIDRYDRAETLFYLDPPYYGCETDYGEKVFSRDDFSAIADRLMALKGRFILSLNDTPEIREIFSAFNIVDVKLNYSVCGKQKPVSEVIIMDKKEPAVANLPR